MNTTIDDTLQVLNELIDICREAAKGFREAADGVLNPALKRVLADLSVQRNHFVNELKYCLGLLGIPTTRSVRAEGREHPGWRRLRQTVASGNEHAVLVECAAREAHVIRRYRDALTKLVERVTCEIVRVQAIQVQASHDWVRDRRDSYA